MPLVIDRTHDPLILATATGVLTDVEYKSHLVECAEATVLRGKPYAYVYDGVRIDRMAPTTRKLQADWINEHRAAIERLNYGCGFAFSGLTRGLLTAVHWLSPPPYPYKIAGSRLEATRWCIDRLRSRGLDVPNVERALRDVDRGRAAHDASAP